MESSLKGDMRKGPWEQDEDELLIASVLKMGEGRWDSLALTSGLRRSGKSCRLRWLNYLSPNVKQGRISKDEEAVIIQLQQQWGNKWSKIAKQLPGRTDNEIKNYWRIRVRKQQSLIRNSAMYENMCMSSEQEFSNAEPDENGNMCDDKQEYSNVISDDICAPTASISKSHSSNVDIGFTDFGIPNSPYETRLSHWMSEFPNNQFVSVNTHIETSFGLDDELLDVHQESVYTLWDT